MSHPLDAKDLAILERIALTPQWSAAEAALVRSSLPALIASNDLLNDLAPAAVEFLAAYDESYVEGGPEGLVASEERLQALLDAVTAFRKAPPAGPTLV